MPIDVVWFGARDRLRKNCLAMLNDMFDLYSCNHFTWSIPPNTQNAVVVIHGETCAAMTMRLNKEIAKLDSVLLILLGDETASFQIEDIEHGHKKLWVQEPIPGRHDFADRFILDGYTPHTRSRIVQCERDLDWVLACQMTHERRWACRDALQGIDWGGVIVESKGYTQGVSLDEYYRLLCRAHIAPCPSGPFSPDSARVAEALECGAVPILDDLSPTRREPGFWKMVLGNHPMPVIHDWCRLPEVIRTVKADWHRFSRESQGFWKIYKSEFNMWLKWDIEELTGESVCMKR